jgi:hypothetical protein
MRVACSEDAQLSIVSGVSVLRFFPLAESSLCG